MKKQIRLILTYLALALASALVVNAQVAEGGPFKLDQSVIAAGGGTSSDTLNNIFSVTGTNGQSLAAGQLSGGQFTVKSGFWQDNTFAPTAAPASISGYVRTADGLPLSGVVVALNGGRFDRTITDANGFYSFIDVDTDNFYVVTPLRVNYTFAPATHAFSLFANKTDAIFTASLTAATANPLDTDLFFVRQHYLDFLSREPDAGGLNYWGAQLSACGSDPSCLNARRIGVSAAFFIEQEFQETGFFVYRLYEASYGRQPRFAEFTADRSRLVAGDKLAESKQVFAEQWVKRAEFLQAYPAQISPPEFVGKLFETAGLASDSTGQQEQTQAMLTAGKTRGQVLSEVIEFKEFRSREYNPSFVLMQYFGYLRRDPEQAGFDFWLNVLNNREPNNYRGMVCSFLTSTEYQQRFSSIVTHSNQECGH